MALGKTWDWSGLGGRGSSRCTKIRKASSRQKQQEPHREGGETLYLHCEKKIRKEKWQG